MSDLHTDVRYIKGIGEARAKALAKLGITDLLSLISYFPRDWEDRSALRTIDTLPIGENCCVRPWWHHRRWLPMSAKDWIC